MATFELFLVLFLAITGHSSGLYCICKDGVSDQQLQKNIDYACGAGADCTPITQNGPCFNPNTIKDHCNYAVNSYYQKKGAAGASCDFSGTATTSPNPPTTTGSGCVYQSSPGYHDSNNRTTWNHDSNDRTTGNHDSNDRTTRNHNANDRTTRIHNSYDCTTWHNYSRNWHWNWHGHRNWNWHSDYTWCKSNFWARTNWSWCRHGRQCSRASPKQYLFHHCLFCYKLCVLEGLKSSKIRSQYLGSAGRRIYLSLVVFFFFSGLSILLWKSRELDSLSSAEESEPSPS